MKIFIKITMINIIIFVSIPLLSCPGDFFYVGGGGTAGEVTVYLKFPEISFGGDWTSFHNSLLPYFLKILLPDNVYASGQTPIQVIEFLEFNENDKNYSLPRYDPEVIHFFRPDTRDPVILWLDVEFCNNDESETISVHHYQHWGVLKSGQTSVIPIRLNIDYIPFTDFSVYYEPESVQKNILI